MIDAEELNSRQMTDRDKAEQALMLLGYVKVKEGVWKHPYFAKSQKINTQTGGNVVLSLHDIFKEWGARDMRAGIRTALGVDE